MSIHTAYYVDDDKEEAEGYIKRLNKIDKSFSVKYVSPPPELNMSIFDSDADLFFIDWALDEVHNDSPTVSYRGHTFATQLRYHFPDKPIALITKKDIFDRLSRRSYLDSLHLFDAYIDKNLMRSKTKEVVRNSENLIFGFETLRNAPKTWQGLLGVLKATSEDASSLGSTSPPFSDTLDTEAARWEVAPAAMWIQNVVLRFPGILYDSLYSATFLGIELNAFLSREVQNLFQPAHYEGILGPLGGRWWRNRLIECAHAVMKQSDIKGNSVNQHFGLAFEKVYGHTLPPARCIYSEKTPADWVCYILQQPVRIEYSLVYHPDSRPSVTDDARVSFKAIRESNEVFDELFDASSQPMLEEIRKVEL